MWSIEELDLHRYRVGEEVRASMHSVNYSDSGTYHIVGKIIRQGHSDGNEFITKGTPSYKVILTEDSEVEGAGQEVNVYESRNREGGSTLYGLW